MSTLHPLCLQATGAVSSYVSGAFAADGKERAGKAGGDGDGGDDEEEAKKENVSNVIGQGDEKQQKHGKLVGSNALIKRAMRLASLSP